MNACPQCGAFAGVIDTEDTNDYRRRRRACKQCGHRFSTVEIPHGQYMAMQAALAGDWRRVRKSISKAMVGLADVVTMIDRMNKGEN